MENIVHGSIQGYQKELFAGMPTCPRCKEAKRIYTKTLKAYRLATSAEEVGIEKDLTEATYQAVNLINERWSRSWI